MHHESSNRESPVSCVEVCFCISDACLHRQSLSSPPFFRQSFLVPTCPCLLSLLSCWFSCWLRKRQQRTAIALNNFLLREPERIQTVRIAEAEKKIKAGNEDCNISRHIYRQIQLHGPGMVTQESGRGSDDGSMYPEKTCKTKRPAADECVNSFTPLNDYGSLINFLIFLMRFLHCRRSSCFIGWARGERWVFLVTRYPSLMSSDLFFIACTVHVRVCSCLKDSILLARQWEKKSFSPHG